MTLANDEVGGSSQPMLSVRGLVKHFPLKKDLLGRSAGVVRAVDGVSFDVFKGETWAWWASPVAASRPRRVCSCN
jgi:peptide/nickel transport system ATP-binding protein